MRYYHNVVVMKYYHNVVVMRFNHSVVLKRNYRFQWCDLSIKLWWWDLFFHVVVMRSYYWHFSDEILQLGCIVVMRSHHYVWSDEILPLYIGITLIVVIRSYHIVVMRSFLSRCSDDISPLLRWNDEILPIRYSDEI